MNHSSLSLPDDVIFKIATSLEATDLCTLGCCSHYWSELSDSDFIWESLVRQRWPLLTLTEDPNIIQGGWKHFYINRHTELGRKAAALVKFVEDSSQSDSIEVGEYLQAIEDLSSMQLGFKDVQMFLFKPVFNVLINLIGLHYCINWLDISGAFIKEALDNCRISDRQVCVKWWKLGRWFYGFRMRDESHSRSVSLLDLVMAEDKEVLSVLLRGAIHEVLRVQISAAGSSSTSYLIF
ncbi:hypothetical protein ACFE04_004987 [Oxalis oulophora]